MNAQILLILKKDLLYDNTLFEGRFSQLVEV